MKKILLAVCLTSMSSFALSMDPVDQVQNRIDEQVKIIEKSFKDQLSVHQKAINRVDRVTNAEASIWGKIIDIYELYRENGVSERYFFLLEATNAMPLPLDQRGVYLEEWAKTMDERAYSLGLSPRFYGIWKQKMSELKMQIKDLVNLSRQTVEIPETPSIPTNKIKELSKSLKTLPPQVVEKKVVVKEVEHKTNYTYLFGSFFAGLALMFIFRRKKNVKAAPQPVKETTLAAFDVKPQIKEALVEFDFEKELSNRPLNLEEISRKCLDKNEDILSLASLNPQHQPPCPFDTSVNIPAEKLADAMNWMIRGIVSLKNTAADKEAKLDWVCKRNKNRVSVDFILKNVKVDAKTLQEDAIINGEGSAPAHFGRCEQILANHFPTVKIKPTDKHTIISLGLESHIGTELTH